MVTKTLQPQIIAQWTLWANTRIFPDYVSVVEIFPIEIYLFQNNHEKSVPFPIQSNGEQVCEV